MNAISVESGKMKVNATQTMQDSSVWKHVNIAEKVRRFILIRRQGITHMHVLGDPGADSGERESRNGQKKKEKVGEENSRGN